MNTKQLYMEWAEVEDNTVPLLGLAAKPKVGSVSPLSPMDSSNGSPMPFIDLKSRSTVTRNDNVVTLSKKAKVVPAPIRLVQQGVSPGLPNPTLGILGLAETKKPGEKKQFCEVLDEDNSPIVCSDDDDEVDNFGIKLRRETSIPAPQYTEGEIKYTTKEALKSMVQNLSSIRKETGCIINETCDPACSQYIPETHFVSAGNLGRGSFGEVDLCVDSKTRKRFVRKTMAKYHFRASEVIAPTTFDHPNITKVFGVVQRDSSLQNSKIELYLEYGGDSLTKLTYEGRRFSSSEIHNLAKQGLQGLKHMDRYNIIHLDIKPENICIMEVNGSLSLKITDFGTSRLPINRLEFVGVTPEYMASEMCKYYLQLQGNYGLNFGLSENDITGAVDVFAFALVIMYMYKRYHIMVKLINKGQTSYNNMGAEEKRRLHLNLMVQMAKDDDGFFVQNLIPDECSLDMRELLIGMTQPNHKKRLTAKQACDFIEEAEKQSTQFGYSERKEILEDNTYKQIPQNLPQISDNLFNAIPDIAGTCMESETGPVKNKTIGLLRKKIQPYDKNGCYGKGSKKPSSMTPKEEMHHLHQEIASKKMQMPLTPVCDFEKLSLEQTLQKQKQQASNKTFGTTSRCLPGAQSLLDTSAESFQDIKAARFPGHDTTECIGQPKLVPTSMFNNTSVQSTANNGRSQVQHQALTGNRMVTIPADVLIRLLQRAQSGQNTMTREANIQPPIINLQAEGLGTNRARHQPVHAPMEESPPSPANIPKFDFL